MNTILTLCYGTVLNFHNLNFVPEHSYTCHSPKIVWARVQIYFFDCAIIASSHKAQFDPQILPRTEIVGKVLSNIIPVLLLLLLLPVKHNSDPH